MYRHDADRRVIGVVGPDPDGGGALLNRARRTTYDTRGNVTLVEAGTTPGYSDANWAAFSTLQQQAATYDGFGRPLRSMQQSSGGTTYALQQVAYDAAGRVDCTAVRMNPSIYGGLPSSACTAGTVGSYGDDVIVQTAYDAVGRPSSTTSGVGSGNTIVEGATYTANGQPASLTDGQGNVSIVVYDGFDRASRLRYPDTTCCTTSTTDYEEYGYDAGSNVVSSRNRAGATTTVAYDLLNRPTLIDAPSGTMDTAFTYDNLGRVLTLAGPVQTLTNVWDALSRLSSETGLLGTMAYQYDLRGAQTRITWPDAVYAQYDHDVYGAVTAIRENGASSGAGVLGTYAYDDLGRRTGIARGNGAATSYGYDAVSRLTSLAHDLAGSGDDVTFAYAYDPANRIVSRTVSNPAYVYAPVTGTTAYANDGLNRVTTVGGVSTTYDSNQNLTGVSGNAYAYDAANRLLSSAASGFSYDPAGRLYSSSGPQQVFQYAGQQLAGEYNYSGVMTVRHVPGPDLDQPVASLSGSGLATRTWLAADERGSVVNLSNSSAVTLNIDRYDEYGVPASANAGRFQYTGQAWLPEAAVYDYRARAYAPQIGRFLQTDPMGYAAGANLYAYVGGDSVNWSDPLGLQENNVDEVPVNGPSCTARGGHSVVFEGKRYCIPNNITLPTAPPLVFGEPPPSAGPAPGTADGCHRGGYGSDFYTPGGPVTVRATGSPQLGGEGQPGRPRVQNRNAQGRYARGFSEGTGDISVLFPRVAVEVYFYDIQENGTWGRQFNVFTDGRAHPYNGLDPEKGYTVHVGSNDPSENTDAVVTVCPRP